MTLKLYAHPFSSYSQKVLVALYENATPFEWRLLSNEHPQVWQELAALWPLKLFPVLVDGGRTVTEASIIIEHLGLHHPGPVSLLPKEAGAAIEVRSMRPVAERDPRGVADARRTLDIAYGWLDNVMADREWAGGDRFSLADCGAAPFLFYADWTHRIGTSFPNVIAYRQRLLARPSFARAVDEARPYRPLFPLGAPDRD